MNNKTNAQKLQDLLDFSFFTERSDIYFFGLGIAICLLFTLWFFPITFAIKVFIALIVGLFIRACTQTLKRHKEIKFFNKNGKQTDSNQEIVDANCTEKSN